MTRSPSPPPSPYDPSRFVLVGPVAAGKTTLFNALIGRGGAAMKTQALDYENGIVDTPGEFFSHPRLHHALINTVSDARSVVNRFAEQGIAPHAIDPHQLRMPARHQQCHKGEIRRVCAQDPAGEQDPVGRPLQQP